MYCSTFLRADDLPGLVEEAVAVPAGVEAAEGGGHAVVLPQPDGVQRQQTQLLVRARVARREAADVALAGVPAQTDKVLLIEGSDMHLHSPQVQKR